MPTAPGGGGDQLDRLLHDDSASARITLHLGLHYSARHAQGSQRALARGRASAGTLAYLSSIDFDALGVERSIRLAQLERSVAAAVPFLWRLLNRSPQTAFPISAFADHDSFWRPRGRTLGENLCLVAADVLAARGEAFVAEVAKVQGILCGFGERPDLACPWPGVRRVDAAGAEGPAEVFDTDRPLLGADGDLAGPPEADRLAAAPGRPHRVVVGRAGDLLCRVSCTPLGARTPQDATS